MNELQALIIGVVAGGLMGVEQIDIEVELPVDADGNYLPYVFVTGKRSGTKLRVSVDVVEE